MAERVFGAASAKCLVPLDLFRSKYYCGASQKTRAVFILGSVGSCSSTNNDEVVSRRDIYLTDDDRDILSNLGLPPDRWNDLSVLLARSKQTEKDVIVGHEISEPGNELSCEFVLKTLREILKNNTDKDGVVIHYFGNGRKNRGDWCFKDGFITFREVMELYMENYRGHILTVISDCSHSGSWLKECYKFMDEQGVGPCGHCAIEKGILLKCIVTCRPLETAMTLGFSVRAIIFDKNDKKLVYKPRKIDEKQTTLGRDFTWITCGKKVDEECGLDTNLTWEIQNESSRIYLVRGNDRGKPAWHYVLLVDEEETIDIFKQTVASGTVDVANFGQVLYSGWGKDPPNEITDKIHKKYYRKD